MPRRYIDLCECLFDAFANPTEADPQERRQMWAIHEGIERIRPTYGEWKPTQANKTHECMRGCIIKKGDTYFKTETGGGWGTDWKFCASCTAMILYFKEVDKLPRSFYTHWDLEKKTPVRLEDE